MTIISDFCFARFFYQSTILYFSSVYHFLLLPFPKFYLSCISTVVRRMNFKLLKILTMINDFLLCKYESKTPLVGQLRRHMYLSNSSWTIHGSVQTMPCQFGTSLLVILACLVFWMTWLKHVPHMIFIYKTTSGRNIILKLSVWKWPWVLTYSIRHAYNAILNLPLSLPVFLTWTVLAALIFTVLVAIILFTGPLSIFIFIFTGALSIFSNNKNLVVYMLLLSVSLWFPSILLLHLQSAQMYYY